jgi:hypothetical protein
MKSQSSLGFSWDFLDEMTVWSLIIGFAIAFIGGFVLQSVAFGVGCVIAVCIDVALVRSATHRARTGLAEGRVDASAPMIMLAGRAVAKAILLVVAMFAPGLHVFSGTVFGALTFDVTLIVVGSIVAASRTMHHTGKAGALR